MAKKGGHAVWADCHDMGQSQEEFNRCLTLFDVLSVDIITCHQVF